MDELNRINSRRYLISLTWPIFVELVLQMLVSNADQAMVSRYSPTAVAAIGNANLITNLLLISFSVICMASTILITQYIGSGSQERVAQTYAVSLVFNFLFSLLICLILLLFPRQIFGWVGVPEQLMNDACQYIRIIAIGIPLQAVYLTFVAFFRANGLTRQTMCISIAINLVNVLGNLILINGTGTIPALGVAGAAISSDLSRMMGVILIIWMFTRHISVRLSPKLLRPFPFDHLKRLLQIGLPAGGESISYNLSQLVIQRMCNFFPLFVISTRVYANMFATLSYIFASAIAQASQIIVGYLMGARRTEETDQRVNATLKLSMTISLVMSCLLYFISRPLFGLFTKDPQILELCSLIMLIEIPLELGRAANIVFCRCMQAAGDIRFPIVLGTAGVWILAVGGGYLLGHLLGLGLAGIWIAMATDECVRGVIAFFRWRSGKWRSKHLID